MWPSGELKGLDHSSTGCPENAQSLANGNPQRANEPGEGMAPFLWFKTVGPQPCGLRPRGRSQTWEVREPGCQGNSPTVINGLCSLASPSWFFHLHIGGWGESSRKFFPTSRPVSCTENANGAASGRPATRNSGRPGCGRRRCLAERPRPPCFPEPSSVPFLQPHT